MVHQQYAVFHPLSFNPTDVFLQRRYIAVVWQQAGHGTHVLQWPNRTALTQFPVADGLLVNAAPECWPQTVVSPCEMSRHNRHLQCVQTGGWLNVALRPQKP